MKSLEPQTVKALYSVVLQYYRVVISFSALFARFQILCRQLILACLSTPEASANGTQIFVELKFNIKFQNVEIKFKIFK